MISWKKSNLELVLLAVLHKFQFNMDLKRMTAFESFLLKHLLVLSFSKQ